jgi:hypothetical protein
MEISKIGANVRLRIREKDPDLVVPTDIEFEGEGAELYALFKSMADTLEYFQSLEEKKTN